MTHTNTEGLSDERLGRFDHHPDPAIDFEIEVQSLEARLFDAKGGISKPGTEPETVETVGAAIERAMTFTVGGDPSAVAAKATLRNLEREAWDHVHAKVTDDLQALGEEFGVLGGENRISGLRRVLTEMRSELSRRAANSAGGVEVKAYLHEPTGNVFSAKDHAILLPKWQRQFAADMTAAEIAADFTPLYTHPSSPVSAEVTEEMVDAAIPHLRNLNIAGKDAWRKAVHNALLAALNGGRDNG